MRLVNGLLVAALILFGAACGTHDADHGHSHDADGQHHEVAWYDGDAEQAFVAAKQEGKPLFLYWGAEWCPPCHELKAKIFKHPKFADKIVEFVPVYLDGDTEGAQILGERFDVQGYPTVIIFSADGQEVMRMPTDVDIDQYLALLDTALGKMLPMDEVLAAVLQSGPANADPAHLNLLAFYSWGQDRKINLEDDEKVATFRTLYEQTPDSLAAEKSRFLAQYVYEATSAERRAEEGAEPVLTVEEVAAARAAVLALLADSELRAANVAFVNYYGPRTVGFFHDEPSPEREELIAAWLAAAEAIEQNEQLAVDERLSAAMPRIWMARIDEEDDAPIELSPELLDHVRERVTWAAETVTDEGELQAVMSTMAYMLEESGLEAEAESLLAEKMNDTHAPYYFMSWIASIKEEADPQEAITWYRKAYDSSRGRYTRFRWGSSYLRQVMDLAPGDVQTIEADSLEILAELLKNDDAFAGGNYSRLNQLASAYESWNEDGSHDAQLAKFRQLVHAECGRFPADGEDSQGSRCASFLNPDDETAEG